MIYLDHAATTPVDPDARQAMEPFLYESFGNPSSIHQLGRRARAGIDDARDKVASALQVDFSEITFTSGGTEAANLAIIGSMLASKPPRDQLLISAIEHPCVVKAAEFCSLLGKEIITIPVDSEGFIDREVYAQSLSERTALVSIMHGNNEIGVVQDIPTLASAAHYWGALFHMDAVQSFGSLPVLPKAMEVDFLSISAHKIYGPKGVGALFSSPGTPLVPLIRGGGQERERRGGTENLAGIVGFGIAAQRAGLHWQQRSSQDHALRDRFVHGLSNAYPTTVLNGPALNSPKRLANNANLSFPGHDGASLLMRLDLAGVAASSGSACSSGSIEPSPVLRAIGNTSEQARSAVRFTVGKTNSEADIDRAIEILLEILNG